MDADNWHDRYIEAEAAIDRIKKDRDNLWATLASEQRQHESLLEEHVILQAQNADYFRRQELMVKDAEKLRSDVKMYRDAELGWESAMSVATGEDGIRSVCEVIDKLREENEALRAEVDQLDFWIKGFCLTQSWSAQAWKDQAGIKPLFDRVRAKAGES
jgi:hypothetical protein